MLLLNGRAGLVFLDRQSAVAHIAATSLHLEPCLHSHSFRGAHGSGAGRQWSLLLGQTPGTMPALGYSESVFLIQSLTVVLAGGGLSQCAHSN